MPIIACQASHQALFAKPRVLGARGEASLPALGSEETLNAELRRELEDARQRLSELHSTP